MHEHSRSIALCLLTAAAAVGCHSLGEPGELTSDSLLKAAEASPGAVTLDIYWARTNEDDTSFSASLWESVQEDRLSVPVRRALAADGLRAGIVGGAPSEEIMRLLNPEGVDLATGDEKPAPLSAAPAKVTRRLRQLSPGRRLEIQASDTPRSMALLRSTASGLIGRTYPDAQGVYAVILEKLEAGRATLKLSPELHHGQPRMKYIPSGPGMVVHQLGRDVELYDELQMDVVLAPGEILVVTCLPNAENRLGGLFHHDSVDNGLQQKYLLVRVSQIPEAQSLAAKADSAWPWH